MISYPILLKLNTTKILAIPMTTATAYWVRGKADYNFSDWQSRLDIDIASDEDFLDEFNTGYTSFDDTQARYVDVFWSWF